MLVAVVHGGTSTECEVSSLNAKYIIKALNEIGHDTVSIVYGKDIMIKLAEAKPDVVYICVQGKYHGDGTLQAILDLMEIPYTGSKMKAAAVINDKIICKKLFRMADVITPNSFELSMSVYSQVDGKKIFLEKMKRYNIKFPCIAKAPSQGGSFGIVLLESIDDYEKIADIYKYDNNILIEQFIIGKFFTVGLLERDGIDDISLPVMEGVSNSKNKLIMMNAGYSVVPAAISEELANRLRKIACKVFAVCEAKGYARVDFIYDDITGNPYVLEINAVPGLKKSSLYPPAAELAGVGYNDLINIILMNSFK